MRKRILTILLALTMLVGLSLLPSAATTDTGVATAAVAEGTFHAGYSIIDITPAAELVTGGLPMSGYGSSIARLTEGFLDANHDGDKTNDGLRATYVAVTDSKQNTVLMFGLDLIGAPEEWSVEARHAIVDAAAEAGVTVDFDNIYLSASHTHSGPHVGFDKSYSDTKLAELQTSDPELYATVMRARTYRLFLYEQLCKLAVAALNDRSEVTLTKGQIDASQTIASLDGISDTSNNAQMNSVRHYKTTTLSGYGWNYTETMHVAGSNFGNLSLAINYNESTHGQKPNLWETNLSDHYRVEEVSKADDMMYLVQLTPKDGKDPIVLVNWRAHNTEDSTTMTKWGKDNYNNISPGYVGILREELEKANCRASFILGAAGNIQDVEATLIKNLQNLTADDGSNLMTYLTYNDAHWAEKSYYLEKYASSGISYLKNVPSRYHLNGLRSRYSATYKIPSATVGAISLGNELSMVVAPFELSDRYSDTIQNFSQIESINDNNKWDKLSQGNNPYGTPLVMGYTNGSLGYLAHALAYDYNNGLDGYVIGAYETSGTGFGKGSGEALIDLYDNMLDTVNNVVKEQCECGGTAVGKYGHTCEVVAFQPWSDPNNLPTIGNYYLTTDVTIREQHSVQQNLHLDLNGHNITFAVSAEAFSSSTTRVFSLSKASEDQDVIFSITDSTGCGRVYRDLSNLTSVQQNTISNWGLIVLVANDSTSTYPATGSFTLYNGILDATGQYSGGGSVVSNGALNFTVTMYGGEMRGGICGNAATEKNASVGAVYSVGHVNMFGGKLYGGLVYNNSGYAAGGIRITVTPGQGRYLTLAGDAEIYGNYRTTNGEDRLEANTHIRWGQLRIAGNYTGKVSITYVDSSQSVKLNPAEGTCIMDNSGLTGMNVDQAEILVDNHPEMAGYLYNNKIYAGTYKDQCECGGKAVGKYGHTCETIRFFAWTSTSSLPTSGNWYLKDHVTTTSQRDVTGTLRIDLNGKNCTHKVAAKETGNTRVFILTTNGAYLSITDSTETPGVISRDLSLKTTAEQEAIGNWGLVCYMGGTVKGLTLYNGILDTTGQYSGGGTIFSNASTNAPLTIYGGELRAGITKGSWGAIHASAPVNLFGGTITGGKIVGGGNAYGGGIRIGDGTYKLTISGDPTVTGNYRVANATAAPTVSNIFVNADQLEIVGTFTGNIGLTPVANNALTTPTANMVMGSCNNATVSGTITVDNYQQYMVAASGSDLVLASAYAAQTDSGMNTYHYDSLSEAFAEYPGNGAVIRLLQDSGENITVTQETYLDLNGFDIAAVNVNKDVNLYVFDSKTDDYTVEDGLGYGKLLSISGDGNVQALPSGTAITKDGYLMITESEGTSFHRLNLRTVSLSLRASEVGVYYGSQFGGDEVVKRNIVAYGSAMGAGQMPNFANKTYTRFDASSWKCGTDANGNSLNLSNGTILTGILQTKNTYSVNKRNSGIQVYSQAYVELPNGDRILGSCVKYSLKEIMEGAEGLNGVDSYWATTAENVKNSIVNMYNTYENIFSRFNIPNIKFTITGESGEDQPYEDDGILKVLLIGHSLGIDSAYFFPEVYKETTGKDIVVGMIYHSGCRLNQHVSYINNEAKQYAYYEFDTSKDITWRRAYADGTFHDVRPGVANDSLIDDGTIGVTMRYGIRRADWDIVVMQAGVHEAANKNDFGSTYKLNIAGDIKTIQKYVLNCDIEKRSTPKFAWNITWATPSIESGLPNEAYTNCLNNFFGGDSTAMYEAIADTAKNIVAPAADWAYILPSGTAQQNARTVMADKELYRDTIHSSDYGRLMFAYVWTCRFENLDIDDCDITSIYGQLREKAADRGTDYALTDAQKVTFKKIVGAALENPYLITDCSK